MALKKFILTSDIERPFETNSIYAGYNCINSSRKHSILNNKNNNDDINSLEEIIEKKS